MEDPHTGYPSRAAERICTTLVPEWRALFLRKNADYGDGANDLGLKGQYAELNRKMTKLKRALWEGKTLTEEPPEEVILDLIGHLFLTLDMMREGIE
jgi:hypothetical protein